ncbi:hypothetical protein CEXT_448161 [Caerostris extrusa]|uniref:Uncharacterized protein n=1 Tax=Caerostris extrusa TaxID=172846 RepID=A0AAV4XTB5_CAEEX|nr:hypothetical protein CEXT_448161 [Caerostris extrusa]
MAVGGVGGVRPSEKDIYSMNINVFPFSSPFVVLREKKMQDPSSVNCSKMPTANAEELILAGIIAFHFKKLKCRFRRILEEVLCLRSRFFLDAQVIAF